MADWIKRQAMLDDETAVDTTITVPDGQDRVCMTRGEIERLLAEAGYEPEAVAT